MPLALMLVESSLLFVGLLEGIIFKEFSQMQFVFFLVEY